MRITLKTLTVAIVGCAIAASLATPAGSDPDPAPQSCGKTFDTSAIRSSFRLRMRLTLPAHWCLLYGLIPGAMSPVHVGSPANDSSQWWGPDIWLVDGARVRKPADVSPNKPNAGPTASTSAPWPADFFAYLSALPGVRVVSGPRPVTIGGIRGRELVVSTPPMHPIVWLAGDTAWMGGGASGVDPVQRRHVVLLRVGGKRLYLGFQEAPAKFDRRLQLVRQLWHSITFGPGWSPS